MCVGGWGGGDGGGGGGLGGGRGTGGGGGGGRFPSVVVFRALLLAHRYLSALTTYFLNVGILYYIAKTYLVYHLLCSPIGYLGLGEIV